jgi:hypothetical protein
MASAAALFALHGMASELEMRMVKYQRHEPGIDVVGHRHAPLSTFVYDVPYLGACGVFPPRHLLNQKLRTGGSQGGMGPGATWEPFEVSESEYSELVRELESLDPRSLARSARYISRRHGFDDSLDHVEDYVEWMRLTCERHRPAGSAG